MSLKETIYDYDWLSKNEGGIKEMLPKTWTHIDNLDLLQVGFSLKLLGVDWHKNEDLAKIMVFLEKTGILMVRDTYQVKVSPTSFYSNLYANHLH